MLIGGVRDLLPRLNFTGSRGFSGIWTGVARACWKTFGNHCGVREIYSAPFDRANVQREVSMPTAEMTSDYFFILDIDPLNSW